MDGSGSLKLAELLEVLGNVGGFGGMLFTRELCTDVALAVDRDGSGNLDLAEFLELVAKVLTVNKTLAMKGLHYDDHLQHLVNGGGTTAALPTTRSEVAIVDAATDGEAKKALEEMEEDDVDSDSDSADDPFKF